MALCKFVVRLANILFIVHVKLKFHLRLDPCWQLCPITLRVRVRGGDWLSLLALGWGIWLIYSCSSWGGYISILLRPTYTGINWTFQDLVHCGIKVNGRSIFKTKNSTRLKTSRGRVNFQETFNLRERKPLRFCICFIFVTMFVDNVSNQEQFVKTFKNKFYLVPFTKEPNITFLYMILSMEHKVNA